MQNERVCGGIENILPTDSEIGVVPTENYKYDEQEVTEILLAAGTRHAEVVAAVATVTATPM
jgi:hypothetical protein